MSRGRFDEPGASAAEVKFVGTAKRARALGRHDRRGRRRRRRWHGDAMRRRVWSTALASELRRGMQGAILDPSRWEFEAKYEQWLPGLALMRDALIQPLSDADLGHDLGGSSLTWGQLIDDCAEMQRSYLDAFRTLDQRRAPPRSALEHRTTVAEILENFHSSDGELKLVLDSFTHDEWEAVIVRPDGTKRSRRGQLEIYAQFMLIFLAKATVYSRVQNRDIPPSLQTFVG
jgi:hypothetical protein